MQLIKIGKQLKTCVYRKTTINGPHLHYQSHVDARCKRSLVMTMLNRAHCLSSSPDLFAEECENLKGIFLKLKYPENLRPRPHVFGYFWTRNFFFPDSKISPSTRGVFKSNSPVHTYPMVSGFTLIPKAPLHYNVLRACAVERGGKFALFALDAISFPEPTCPFVSVKTRSSGIIHFKSPRFWDFRSHGACVPWFKTWW